MTNTPTRGNILVGVFWFSGGGRRLERNGEILRVSPATPFEFIEEMKFALTRSRTKTLLGYQTLDDASMSICNDGSDADKSRAMITITMGAPVIDDYDAPVTRNGGTRSTPVYDLEKPSRWPDGLFEKLVAYTWVIDVPISPLDDIADRV